MLVFSEMLNWTIFHGRLGLGVRKNQTEMLALGNDTQHWVKPHSLLQLTGSRIFTMTEEKP